MHACMVRQQRIEQPAQTNGLSAQLDIDQLRADGRGIPFGEHPIDDGEHAFDSLLEHCGIGRLIRNAGVADFFLGAHQALRHRVFADQKGARHGLRGQSADFAQGERDLRFLVERRMTAGEYQTQPIVAENLLVGRIDRRRRRPASAAPISIG